jgi:Uncharacterized proteins, homologs of microcin C7 resistance protein MccF
MRLGEQGYDRSILVRMLKGDPNIQFPVDHTSVLRSGEAEGRLAGGCLSMVVATLGTSFEIDTDDTILSRRPRREALSDRPHADATQAGGKTGEGSRNCFWRNAGLHQSPESGIHPRRSDSRRSDGTTFPILYGFSTGHTSRANIVVPFGIHAKLSLGSVSRFELLESAVSHA